MDTDFLYSCTAKPVGYKGAGLTDNCGLNPQLADCNQSDFAGESNASPFCYISANGD